MTDNSTIAPSDITLLTGDHMPTQPTLGLLGGLGVGATVLYYEGIAAACGARGFVPKLVIAHAHAPTALALVTAGRIDELAAYLAVFANQLAAAGADVLTIPAITPHICLAQLQRLTPLPFIDILDVTVATIQARKLKRIALFGTRFTIEQQLFGRLGNFDIVAPQPAEIDEVHRLYVEIATSGHGTPQQESQLRDLAHRICRRDGVEAIVLAGTDLNLVFNERNTDFPAVDCAHAHIDAIVTRISPD
jgi:aspartate racemase